MKRFPLLPSDLSLRCLATAGLLGLGAFAAPATAGYMPLVNYASYFGGSNGRTIVKDIKVNAAGEVYLAGYTDATNMPGSPGPGQTYRGGMSDGFVAKFSADMNTLIYFQYLGTTLDDELYALALDAAGNAYAVGYTHATVGAFDETQGDAVIYKVSYSGFSVGVISDTIGGANNVALPYGDDRANDIALAPNGTLVVAGRTTSQTFPGAAGSLNGGSDGFVVRYDSNLFRLSSRYVHHAYDDGVNGLDVGSDGWITLAGWSATSANAARHVWATRLNPTATSTAWSQTYQGNGAEEAFAVRVNAQQQAWLTGVTSSSNFAAGSVIDSSFAGPDDAFVMRALPANGHSDYRSYLGGPGSQRGRAIDIAANGDVIVAGANQPNAGDNGSSTQAFVLRLNAPSFLTLDYSVPYGDPNAADVFFQGVFAREDDIAVTWSNQSVYLAGRTAGAQFSPITLDAYQLTKPSPWQHVGFFLRSTNNGE